MKFKVAIASVTLLLVTNSWADAKDPYYSIEEISVTATGANYGPYPSAMANNGTLIGTYSMKATLSRDIDIGLPFTFNRPCQYDDVFCELRFYGSEDTDDVSNENAYQAWRNAQADAEDDRYSSYMMGNAFETSDDEDSDSDTITITSTNAMIYPYETDTSFTDTTTDVKVTDVAVISSDNLVVGYSSDAYTYNSTDGVYERDFVRRAFVYNQTDGVTLSLFPDFYENDANDDDDADYDATTDANGGLSGAYKIKTVTIDNYTLTLVVGSGSISLPQDDDEDDAQDYFDACYFSDEDDEIGTLNELVYCSGFDTQAWAWDVTDLLDESADAEVKTGFELASEWLDDNEDNNDEDNTYSASALDINSSGIAVGVSTFAYNDDSATGGRQRAIIMTPYFDDNGDDSYTTTDNVYADEDKTAYSGGDIYYGAPIELSKASYSEDEGDDGDDDDTYNTWAVAITDGDPDVMVIGNRELSVSQNSNKATEFFVYNLTDDTIDIPLEDKKVLTTEQKNDGDSSSFNGANSRAYDINESGMIVGKADDYDQTHPVNGGMPRTQSAFLYDSDEDSDDYDESWFINDLICSRDDDGVVTSPRYKIRSARVIDNDGTVLAEGLKYDTDDDYQNETNSTGVMLKLTINTKYASADPTDDDYEDYDSPGDSPNCWDSDLLNVEDEDYDRSGGASFWLWIFALPLLLVRRFYK